MEVEDKKEQLEEEEMQQEELKKQDDEEDISSDFSEGSLDEEDRELIEENMRKRSANGPSSNAKKANVLSLENLFDDEEEEEEKGLGEEKRLTSLDDMEDFIVSDEDKSSASDVSEEEKERKVKPLIKKITKLPAARTFSSFKVSNDVYSDLMEVFGDPQDYQDMLDSFNNAKISSPITSSEEKEELVENEASIEIEVTREEIEFVLHELHQVLGITEAERDDVELVLKYLEEDKLEVIYLEAYQQDLSLNGDTLWAIYDAHLQWKALRKERSRLQDLGISLNGIFIFDTLPEFISRFYSTKSSGKIPVAQRKSNTFSEDLKMDFERLLPDPVELTIILKEGSFYEPATLNFETELLEYAAWMYALHPASFQFFALNANQDWSLQAPSSLNGVIQKAQEYVSSYIKRRREAQEARKKQRQSQQRAVQDFNGLLGLRPLRLENDDEIGVVLIQGKSCACLILEVQSGKVIRNFKSPLQFEDQNQNNLKIVIGGKGPQVKTTYENLSKKFACYLVKPLAPTGDIEVDCLALGRFAIDPALEIANRPKLSALMRLEEDVYEVPLKRALIRYYASKGVNMEECFGSEWRQQPLRLLPGMTMDLAEALTSIKSREQMRGMMSEEIYRNLAGFLLFPNSKEPLDNTLAHPQSRHPSMMTLGEGTSDSVIGSGEQIMEMVLGERLSKGKVYSGPVIKNDYPHALVIKLPNGVEGVIKGPSSRVPVGQMAAGELVRVDADRYRLELYSLPSTTSATHSQNKSNNSVSTIMMGRIGMHPLYKEISGRQVVEHFQNNGLVGDVIVRPSRTPGHISISWKVSPMLTQHLDVELTSTGKLRVMGEVCEDVDEIVARLIDPLAQLVDSIQKCSKYFDCPTTLSNNEDIKSLVEKHLTKGFVEGRIAYCLWLSREEPGAVLHISSLPAAGHGGKHESAKLMLGGYIFFRSRQFDSLEKFISEWKSVYSNNNNNSSKKK